MADEFDVDAMLEAAYMNKGMSVDSHRMKQVVDGDHRNGKGSPRSHFNGDDHRESSERYDRKGDRDRRNRGSRSKERRRSRSRSHERRRSRSRDRGRSSRDRRDPRSSRDQERSSRSDRDRDDRRRRSRSREIYRIPRTSLEKERRRSPPRPRGGPSKRSDSPKGGGTPLSPEERDARTVFCMQLSQRVRARDLEEFFSSVGKVRDVRMITCNKTRRFKGIAYVEFKDIDSVALALGLGGQKLMGIPIIVQPSQAEKNRAGQMAKAGAMAAAMATSTPGPMKLYIGSLHFNITEDMLRGIFEPFGQIDEILLMKDHETNRSKGFGFITFHEGEDAKRAMEQLNGFEIAGRPMKVGYVTEKSENNYFHNPNTFLDTDEMDRAGVNLGVTGRLQLMAKLAEGTDLKLPEAAASALNIQNQPAPAPVPAAQTTVAPPIATQCFMLSNMFDMEEVSNPSFEADIRDEVIEACLPFGGAVHVKVDTTNPGGNVCIKCPTIATAVQAVNSLHGRWFGGRVITAGYVPPMVYHSSFPDAMTAQTVLRPRDK